MKITSRNPAYLSINLESSYLDEAYKTYWKSNGTVMSNDMRGYYYPVITEDGNGGALIAWCDNRSLVDLDIYAQRVYHNGTVCWGENGTIICNAINDQKEVRICSDGNGGAIIAWIDTRDDNKSDPDYNEIYGDIYAQRILANGSVCWDDNGTVICNAINQQELSSVCYDGEGGVIISWTDDRANVPPYIVNVQDDLYMQRILLNGTIRWGNNGTLICNADGMQYESVIYCNGTGGIFTFWCDARTFYGDVYGQRLDKDGNSYWGNNGTAIFNATHWEGLRGIVPDGQGNIIVGMIDSINPPVEYDLYAQKVDFNGNKLWGENGTVICNKTGVQLSPEIITDGNAGIFCIWEENEDIYAQRVNSEGQMQWDINGTVVCNAPDDQLVSSICSDGNNGAYITWQDHRYGLYADIYAQKIDLNGNAVWSENGEIVCNANDYQSMPKIISDTNGGAIIVWRDRRKSIYSYADIYAQRIGPSLFSDGPEKNGNGDDKENPILIIIYIIIIGSVSIVTSSLFYYYTRRKKLERDEFLNKKKEFKKKIKPLPKSREILEKIVDNSSFIQTLKNIFPLKAIDSLNIELEKVSEEFLNKVDEIGMKVNDKTEFIKEMLGLSEEERNEFIDGILKKKNSEKLND